MRDIFVTAVVFGALLLVFKHPHYGIYLWSWLSYMNPHKLAWGFATNIPFAFMTAVVTLTAYLFSKEPKRMPWTPETILLIIFLGWVTFTTFFAFYPQLAWEQWDKVLKIQIMTLLTAMLITDRKRLDGLVWVIALSLAFYGVKGGIFTILHGGVYHVQGPATTFIAGNNELGLALIMTVPLLRYLHLQAQNKLIRLWASGQYGIDRAGSNRDAITRRPAGCSSHEQPALAKKPQQSNHCDLYHRGSRIDRRDHAPGILGPHEHHQDLRAGRLGNGPHQCVAYRL